MQVVDERYPILAYTSSVGEIGIIKESFYRSGNNGAFQGLFSKEHKFTLKELQFILPSIKKHFDSFGYDTGMANVMELKIQLPTKRGKIDFDFMESFIAELESERIAELSAYLKVSGLDNYELSTEEEKAVQDFVGNKIYYEEYSVGEMFEVKSYKKRFDGNKVKIHQEGKFPYVVRMGTNNGQKGYINEDEQFLNDGNTISFGQDTATMFYQEKPYFTGDKIKILKPKNNEFNKINSQYFLTVMAQSFSLFSWGSSKFDVKTIESQKILLPIRNKKIDYEFMESFVSAIHKLVIKDVVLYADKKIDLTKTVINKKT